MGPSVMAFGMRALGRAEVEGKTVLEVGSYDVNGSLRPYLESLHPTSYLGVDIQPGPMVDEICNVNDLVTRFGVSAFDVVVCTESLEHMADWRRAISEMKRVLKPGGKLLVTTVGIGFPYHPHPEDYWRFEPADMRQIFSDCRIDLLETAPAAFAAFSVFVLATKPENFQEVSLDDCHVFAITPTDH